MDTLTNQNGHDDQLEWPLWPIRKETDQSEWTPAITAPMAVAVRAVEYQPDLGQHNCAKLVNAQAQLVAPSVLFESPQQGVD